MNNIINSTQFITAIKGKPQVGFCIDDDSTAWVNTKILANPLTILNAAFDGVAVITINSEQFVCAEWAKIELNQAFCDDAQALEIIAQFFELIDKEKQKILGAYHAKH